MKVTFQIGVQSCLWTKMYIEATLLLFRPSMSKVLYCYTNGSYIFSRTSATSPSLSPIYIRCLVHRNEFDISLFLLRVAVGTTEGEIY